MAVILATASYDETLRFWDPSTARCTAVIGLQQKPATAIAISPDKRSIIAASNPTIRMFEVPDGSRGASDEPVITFAGHTAAVSSVGWHRRGKFLLSGSEDGTVKVWTTESPKAVRSLDCKSPVTSVSILPNMVDLVAVDRDGRLNLWDLRTGLLRQRVRPTAGPAEARRLPLSAVGVSSRVSCVAAASHSGLVHLWRAQKGLEGVVLRPSPTCLEAHADYVTRIAFSPSSSAMVTASADKTARLWAPARADSHSGGSRGRGGAPPAAAAAGDSAGSSSAAGAAAAAGSAGGGGASAAPAGGGASSASAADEAAAAVTWVPTASLIGHEGWVWDATFNADGSYVFTGGADATARLWEAASGDLVQTFAGHSKAVCAVAVHDAQVPAATSSGRER
ncbi:hypothetical protein FNF31_07541 [Cafeteria roenbergensis]|uniref:Uncharacterized protein n=2 Tax=Cafeteria roenbergensis TaxID=33653 RepID=A0A5A8C3T5_CAFRO|nr:hypothetical protein FNF31_07541 [Cafeteria roenbergensis]